MWNNTIQHEFIHAAGFMHMHGREDRDAYVRINTGNIQPIWLSAFRKENQGQYNSFNTPYDYRSIMHYTAYTFAINYNIPTIYTYDQQYQNSLGMGYNNGPTIDDFRRLNRMYQCTNVKYF
jgi:hypothetical protein